MFELLENTLQDKRQYYIFDKIESLRQILAQDNTVLEVEDLGAGSHTTKQNQRSISNITSSAVSPAYQCQFLYKLAQFMNAEKMIELGTSLGLSSLYLSSYSKKVQLISLEGSKAILEQAKINFAKLKQHNIKTILGHFDQSLPIALENFEKVDLIYIDGNHAKAPTLKYFEYCLPKIHNKSVIIFDDIYWSKKMTEAWEEIKAHPKVKLSLDLFYFGIVFFNKDIKQKQSFKILDSRFKFWQKYI